MTETEACDSHAVSNLGKQDEESSSPDGHMHFDFTVEQHHWDTIPARGAHNLHDEGKHVHDKTHEEYYRFAVGASPAQAWSVRADMPYVVRGSLEIEDHDRLGEKEKSEGPGDLLLTASYRMWTNGTSFAGPVFGIKMPTGGTKEENSVGVRFEPELQPGSGSFDFPMGVAAGTSWGSTRLGGNVIYVAKTEGDQNYEFGDVATASVFWDTALLPSLRAGIDLTFEHEERHTEAGDRVTDSGGDTLLIGPTLELEVREGFEAHAGIRVPVYQNMGGVHQELYLVWTAGAHIDW